MEENETIIDLEKLEKDYEEAKKLTNMYGQGHLLTFYEQLNDSEKRNLLDDILSVDFQLMAKLYKEAGTSPMLSGAPDLSPMPCTDSTTMSDGEKKKLYDLGMTVLLKGQMAALTMAGGQGTRLGHDGPKGTYDIGLPTHKSLFEIQCDGLKSISVQAGRTVVWYIMTSQINHNDTVKFFEENNYFGYPKEKIYFFPQTMIPVLTEGGKLQLETKSKLLKSPNGNGGLFQSLLVSGALADMKSRGVEWVFICGIDNCLVQMADPLFMGFVLKSGNSVAAKSFIKRSPGEKAGVFCYRNGKPGVVEYTEIPKEFAEMKDEKGVWVYGDTNVLNYIFRIDVIEKIAGEGMSYHTAIKKITYLNRKNELVVSTEPDSYKFELFLFDSFMLLDKIGVFRIERTHEFAPVKNKTGEDSAELALKMFCARQDELEDSGKMFHFTENDFARCNNPLMFEVQKLMLKIMDEYDRICKKHNIEYFLSGGSALGAKRHGGFIPWDDDIDIGMKRSEFNKFIEVCPKELNEKFYFQCEEIDPEYPLPVAKIRLKGTTFITEVNRNQKFEQGIYLDIIPYDLVPNSPKMRNIHKKLLNLFDQAVRYKFDLKLDHTGKDTFIFNMMSKCSREYLTKSRRKIRQNMHPKENKAKYISALLAGEYDKIRYNKEIIGTPVVRDDITFEGRKLPVPQDLEGFLTSQFGDYMKLPPLSKREAHKVIEIKI